MYVHICFVQIPTPTHSPPIPLPSPIGVFSLINTYKYATLKPGLLFLKSLILIFHYVSMCACVYGHVSMSAVSEEDAIRFTGAEVTGSFQTSYMVGGN